MTNVDQLDNTETAVTGQQIPLHRSDGKPSIVEFFELLETAEASKSGPPVVGGEFGPKRYCQIFKAGKWAKISEEKLLVCDHLKGESTKPEGAYVQLQVVSGGEFSLGERYSEIEPSSVAVWKVGDHPHPNRVGDEVIFPESVT